jgi:hypothetical protein
MRSICSLLLFVTFCVGWLHGSHGFHVTTRRTRVVCQHFKDGHQKIKRSVQLWARTDDDADDDDGDGNKSQETPTPSFVPVGVAAVAFVAFWPLLALLRVNGPTTGFDIDMFMALKGILDTSPDMGVDEIYELPALSPAEQLVGAIFGPPTR